MTRKLEEIIGLPPLSDLHATEEKDEPTPLETAEVVLEQLSNSEKVDNALTSVSGLDKHDAEMDDIALKALDTFRELKIAGENMSDLHAGKIYEVAASMIKVALDAKESKVNKKLKMIDLQLKKIRLDQANKATDDDDDKEKSESLDRNEILRLIKEKSDK